MPIQAGTTVHNDFMHVGNAARDVNNGVAGLDANGLILATGAGLSMVRNVGNDIHIIERTSGEEGMYYHRNGVNDYTTYLKVAAAWKEIQHDGHKDVANGIAALDANVELNGLNVMTQKYLSISMGLS